MLRRRALVFVLGLVGIALLLGAAATALVVAVDFRPIIEDYASSSLGRRLTIGALRIEWGDPLAIEVDDVGLANAPWGSSKEMLHIARVAARIDPWSLLQGIAKYESLSIEKPVLLLERGPDGQGNWHFKGAGPSLDVGLALIPKSRTQFPTLLDLALHDGRLTYRASHSDLVMDFHDLTIRSPDDEAPVRLTLDGAYNGLKVAIEGETRSFASLRDAAIPFGVRLSASAAPAQLAFDGSLTEPLDFEGVGGRLTLEARDLASFVGIFGVDLGVPGRLSLAGGFTKTGERWHLTDAKGSLSGSDLTGALDLTEGARGGTDALALDLDFAALDLTPLIAGRIGAAPGMDLSLRLDKNPGATIAARITARRLRYGATQLADVRIDGGLGAGAVSLNNLSFALAGGRIDASGAARSVAAGTSVAGRAILSAADASQLARAIGIAPGAVAGRLDAGATIAATGATLSEAMRSNRGEAVLSMTGGSIARKFLEQASTDLRALFRTGEGMVPITCLLGIAELHDGSASIAKLRLSTPEAALVGGGTVDLATRRADMTLAAERAASFFALGLPLHVTGDFAKLSVSPVLGSSAALPDAAERNAPASRLVPELRALAEHNPCLAAANQ